MADFLNITDFLEPLNLSMISDDESYKDGQLGKVVNAYEEEFPDIDGVDIVIVGCNEQRGNGGSKNGPHGPDAIRRQFYRLFYWHSDVRLADAGNIRQGASLGDTYAALKTVVKELTACGKTVIILGGSHDLTLAQYYSYADTKRVIDMACVDAKVDLSIEIPQPSGNFLMEVLTGEPNFIRHYNHIGFQIYYVHPQILQTMDRLRFDCYRVGHVKDNLEEMEPVLRNCQLFSFDISAIAHSYAPANNTSPNGFDGEQACTLMRFAGMSTNMNTIGIYGYSPENDKEELTAMQISHMMWYIIDGRSKGVREAALEEKNLFNEYHTVFAEVETIFLQSKRTGRWWMQLPDSNYIACSHNDYLLASSNEIPERWLRAQERS